ncbi:hypothetical protein N752_16430 [Desulforamulus aquiferis]|nr:hypothetical protein [Desulforamulus aquiferis]RYD03976.1 hypothetical protein N752_16430 [Desulforamulus aquiferis]
MTLHNKRHTLQEGVPHEQMITKRGELVKGTTEDESVAKEMAPSHREINNNNFKTPPNNLTTKNHRKMGMGEKG